MKMVEMQIGEFSDEVPISEMCFREGNEIIVVASPVFDGMVVNVFSPKGAAFWNFGVFNFSEKSFNFSQNFLYRTEAEEVIEGLSPKHMLFCGDVLRSFGGRFFCPRDSWRFYCGRHFSVSLDFRDYAAFLEFVAEQVSNFGDDLFVKRSEDRDLSSFGWEDRHTSWARILSSPAAEVVGLDWSAISFLEKSRLEWPALGEYWFDPCPVAVADETTDFFGERGIWLDEMRMRLVSNCCPVRRIAELNISLNHELSRGYRLETPSVLRWRYMFERVINESGGFLSKLTQQHK